MVDALQHVDAHASGPVKFGAFVAPASPGVMPPDKRRPFRIILGWQGGWAVLAAGLAGWLGGRHGAVSAALGGAVAIAGCLAFAWLVGRNRALTADGILLTALKAEAVKVLVLFGLLAIVLAAYKNVVVVALIGSFIVSILIFGFAFFIRDA
jgi:ATP synthase protein I